MQGGKTQTAMDILSSLVANGDLRGSTTEQRTDYYKQVCKQLGLDPMLQPFKIISVRGREILYCGRSGAQQLNKLHKVSHKILARELISGCYMVTVNAATPDGRCTESIGVVPIQNLRGEYLCNAMMKAETKAKRRATLDLLGLGMLDETEAESIPYGESLPYEVYAPKEEGIPESMFLSEEGLKKAVSNCLSEEALLKLYNENKERIDVHPELKHLFTERKQALRGAIAA